MQIIRTADNHDENDAADKNIMIIINIRIISGSGGGLNRGFNVIIYKDCV